MRLRLPTYRSEVSSGPSGLGEAVLDFHRSPLSVKVPMPLGSQVPFSLTPFSALFVLLLSRSTPVSMSGLV